MDRVEEKEIIFFVTPTVMEEIIEPGEVLEIKPFCNFCNSKGVRHKLNCTRPQ